MSDAPLLPDAPDVTSASGSSPARLAYALAAILLGQAIGVDRERLTALALVVAAIVACAAGLAIRPGPEWDRRASRWLKPAWGLGVIAGFLQLPLHDRGLGDAAADVSFAMLAALAAALALIIFLGRSRSLGAACFLILIAVFILLGASYLTVENDVFTDVRLIQWAGCDALLSGHNPFAITFRDIYGPDSPIYRSGLVVHGQVQCGYFYPPLSLLLDLPGFLAGDVRYSHIVAMALSAWLVAHARPGRANPAPAVMLLFTPSVFHQFKGAWFEPLLLLLLCAALFLTMRGHHRVAAAALGLLAVGKQYALFVVPAVWVLLPRPVRRGQAITWVLVAAAAGCVVTLPFVLWNPKAFFHSQSALYVGMLRTDSISFAPIIARATGWRPSLILPAVAALPATLLALARAPRTAGGFAASSALILLCVFAFSTQAFGNYYFLAAGTLCAASALR